MTARAFTTTRLVPTVPASLCAFLAATSLAIPSLAAQELVQVTGQDRLLDPDFEEVFRVGVVEGEPWEMFGRLHKVALDARGNLYVFDGAGGFLDMSLRVLVFDRSGGFVRDFGSAGQGPGEFRWATGYAVTRDGITIVGDRGHRAYQIFDESGDCVRMVRPPDGAGGAQFWAAILSDPRGVAVFAGDFGTSDGLGGGSGPPPSSRPVMRLGLGSDVVEIDTLVHAWLPPRGEPGEGLPQNIQIEGRTVDLSSAYGNRAMPSVFEPPLLAGILPDGGIVYSDSSAYALKVTSPVSREIARIITRPFRPAPVTPSVIEGFAKGPEAARLRALRAGMAAGTGFRVTGSDDVGAASDEHRHPRGGCHRDARRLRPGRPGRVHRTR